MAHLFSGFKALFNTDDDMHVLEGGEDMPISAFTTNNFVSVGLIISDPSLVANLLELHAGSIIDKTQQRQ